MWTGTIILVNHFLHFRSYNIYGNRWYVLTRVLFHLENGSSGNWSVWPWKTKTARSDKKRNLTLTMRNHRAATASRPFWPGKTSRRSYEVCSDLPLQLRLSCLLVIHQHSILYILTPLRHTAPLTTPTWLAIEVHPMLGLYTHIRCLVWDTPTHTRPSPHLPGAFPISLLTWKGMIISQVSLLYDFFNCFDH